MFDIFVTPEQDLIFENQHYVCVWGREGLAAPGTKREGDGKTPCGTFALGELFYRPDKVTLPPHVAATPITRNMGWCDDPQSPQYNRPVALPFEGSHEELWRDDDAYDIVWVIEYNRDPAAKGLGSAIFFHVNNPDDAPTLGCISLQKEDFLKILEALNKPRFIHIGANPD